LNLLSQLTAALLIALMVATSVATAETRVSLPRTGLVSDDLAVIVNDDDPLSQQIGSYYQKARGIPAANMIHLKFKPGHSNLTKDEFLQLKSVIDRVRFCRVVNQKPKFSRKGTAPLKLDGFFPLAHKMVLSH
jgi:hypothetical protein